MLKKILNSSYDIVHKLADLYTVKSHMAGTGSKVAMPQIGPVAPNITK